MYMCIYINIRAGCDAFEPVAVRRDQRGRERCVCVCVCVSVCVCVRERECEREREAIMRHVGPEERAVARHPALQLHFLRTCQEREGDKRRIQGVRKRERERERKKG